MNDQSLESKATKQEPPTKVTEWTSIIKSLSLKGDLPPNRTLESYQQALIDHSLEMQTAPSKAKPVKKNVKRNESNL